MLNNDRRRITRSVVAAAAVLTGAVVVGSPSASAREDQHHVTFESSVAGDPATSLTFDLSRCGPPPGIPTSPCVVPTTPQPGLDWTFTGDIQGTVKNENGFIMVVIEPSPTATRAPFIDLQKFTGTVEGCGQGSFVLQIDSPGPQLPFSWHVVSQSGDGELAMLSGGGTGTPTIPGSGNYTGHLQCGVHR